MPGIQIQQADESLVDLCISYRNATPARRKQMLMDQNRIIRELPTDLTSNAGASEAYKKMVDAAEFVKYTQILRAMENQEFFEVMGDYSGMFDHLDNLEEKVKARAPQEKTPAEKKITSELIQKVKANFEIKVEDGEVLMRYKKPLDQYTKEDWDDFHTAQMAFLEGTKRTVWAHITEGVATNTELKLKQLYPGPQMMGELENGAVDKVYVDEKGQFTFVEVVKGKPQLPAGGMRGVGKDNDFTEAAKKLLEEFLEEENGRLYETAADKYGEIEIESFRRALSEVFINADPKNAVTKAFKAVLGDKTATFTTEYQGILDSGTPNAKMLKNIVDLIDRYKPADSNIATKKAFNEFKASVQVATFKLHPLYEATYKVILENSTAVKARMITDGRQVGGSQDSIIFILRKDLREHFRANGITDFHPGDDLADGRYVKRTMLDILGKGVRWMHGAVACIGLSSVLGDANADPNQYKKGYTQGQYNQVRHQLAEQTAFARVSGKSDDHKTDAEQSLERYIATRSNERIDQGKEHHSKSAAFFTHMSAKNKISAAVKMLNKLRDPENAELLTPAEQKCIKDGRLKEIISAINFEKDTKRSGPE